jgi:hypothetical protein
MNYILLAYTTLFLITSHMQSCNHYISPAHDSALINLMQGTENARGNHTLLQDLRVMDANRIWHQIILAQVYDQEFSRLYTQKTSPSTSSPSLVSSLKTGP